MRKNRSYPESLSQRDFRERENMDSDLKMTEETLSHFKIKDHSRTELFADMGSPSSSMILLPQTLRERMLSTALRAFNYMLERGEKNDLEDSMIGSQSYLGFYYFCKWLIRSLFLLLYTTTGNIGGKEIGCLIKESNVCSFTVVQLSSESPHLLASIIGTICGLLSGQWIGRYAWDKFVSSAGCIFLLFTRSYVYIIGGFLYAVIVTLFSLIFYYFIPIDNDQIVGGVVGGLSGGVIGILSALLAIRKRSACSSPK